MEALADPQTFPQSVPPLSTPPPGEEHSSRCEDLRFNEVASVKASATRVRPIPRRSARGFNEVAFVKASATVGFQRGGNPQQIRTDARTLRHLREAGNTTMPDAAQPFDLCEIQPPRTSTKISVNWGSRRTDPNRSAVHGRGRLGRVSVDGNEDEGDRGSDSWPSKP